MRLPPPAASFNGGCRVARDALRETPQCWLLSRLLWMKWTRDSPCVAALWWTGWWLAMVSDLTVFARGTSRREGGEGGCVTTVWEEQHYKPPCPLLLPQSVTSLTLQPSITSKFLFPQNLVFQQLLNVIQYAIKWGQIPACWCSSFIPAHIKRPLGGLQGWWRVILRGAPC